MSLQYVPVDGNDGLVEALYMSGTPESNGNYWIQYRAPMKTTIAYDKFLDNTKLVTEYRGGLGIKGIEEVDGDGGYLNYNFTPFISTNPQTSLIFRLDVKDDPDDVRWVEIISFNGDGRAELELLGSKFIENSDVEFPKVENN